MNEILYHACQILDVNRIIPTVNVQTIFGHTPVLNFSWTETCLTSRTSDGLGQIFFLKLTPLVLIALNLGVWLEVN